MRLITLAALLTLFVHTHLARGASGGEFDIGFGGSLLRDSGGAEMDDQWGVWLQPRVSFAPFDARSELRFAHSCASGISRSDGRWGWRLGISLARSVSMTEASRCRR